MSPLFFTSLKLMQNLPNAFLGTYMKNRYNTPAFKNSTEFLVTEDSITAR